MTESLKVLDNVRKQRVIRDVDDKFRELQEKKDFVRG
jgi:hypothetical protein